MKSLTTEARRMALSKGQRPASKGSPFVYCLRPESGTLYIGATEDLDERIANHATGRACRTTALDPPVCLVWLEFHQSFSDARKLETQIKRWSRAKKEALISGALDKLHKLARSREHLR